MVISQQFRTIPARRTVLQPLEIPTSEGQQRAGGLSTAHSFTSSRQRGVRLPAWLVIAAVVVTLAGALAMPLQFWWHPPATAASPLGTSGLLSSSSAPNPPGSGGSLSADAAPTQQASTQEIDSARQALAQLTSEFQRAQHDNDDLRDAVQAQSQQVTDAQAGQNVANQQRQDEVATIGNQYQSQVTQLQGQVESAAQTTQDRLTQIDQSVAATEKLDAALRAKVGLPAITYASTTMPDLKSAANPQAAAQDAFNSLQARIDAVTTDLNTVSAKADALARAREAARTATTGQFIWPTQGTITQPFGPTSVTLEPAYDGYAHFHQGMDIANNQGTPILAADGGTVIFAGWTDAGYGNCVQIDHGNGLVTLYGHMAQLPMVTVGQKVAKGQQIGIMGTTGNSTGPHLHFAVLKNGVWTDPANYLPAK